MMSSFFRRGVTTVTLSTLMLFCKAMKRERLRKFCTPSTSMESSNSASSSRSSSSSNAYWGFFCKVGGFVVGFAADFALAAGFDAGAFLTDLVGDVALRAARRRPAIFVAALYDVSPLRCTSVWLTLVWVYEAFRPPTLLVHGRSRFLTHWHLLDTLILNLGLGFSLTEACLLRELLPYLTWWLKKIWKLKIEVVKILRSEWERIVQNW